MTDKNNSGTKYVYHNRISFRSDRYYGRVQKLARKMNTPITAIIETALARSLPGMEEESIGKNSKL